MVDDIAAVWDRLNDAFIALYGEILRNTATVRWHANAMDNFSHHLMAYAQFERVGHPDDEDLVIEVNVTRGHGPVTWIADAGQSRGLLLDDGVTRTAPGDVPLSSWVGDALADTIAWLQAETPNFIAYLNQEPTPYDVD